MSDIISSQESLSDPVNGTEPEQRERKVAEACHTAASSRPRSHLEGTTNSTSAESPLSNKNLPESAENL